MIIDCQNGISMPLRRRNPNADFIEASNKAICPNMKRITLEKIVWSLEDMQYKVMVPEQIRLEAKKALDRMIGILPAK